MEHGLLAHTLEEYRKVDTLPFEAAFDTERYAGSRVAGIIQVMLVDNSVAVDIDTLAGTGTKTVNRVFDRRRKNVALFRS